VTARLLSLLVLTLCVTSCTRPPSPAPEPHGDFDYYLLSLSWAPEFCATHASAESSSECDPSRRYGFIVHGLWPQNEDGSYPRDCAPARPVAQDTVRRMLAIMPNRGLIQHEWAEHGTCSGLDAQGYFAQIESAFQQLQVPAEYRTPSEPLRVSPSQIEQKFADNNRAPSGAFRVFCHEGDLVGIEVCLTKDLKYRSCGGGMRECRSRSVNVRPVP
jgi:ribonuclease T2